MVDVTRDSAAIAIRNPSSIVIEDLDLPAGPALVTPQSFSLEELNVKADFANEPHYVFDGLLETVSLDTEINAGGMQQFLSTGPADVRFAGSFSESNPLKVEGTIRSASVRLAQEDYQIEDLEVTYKLRNDGNDIEASYSFLAADKGPEPPLFNPFPVAGRLNLKNGNIEADGTADWGLADPQLKFTAHYNPDQSKIQAEITLSPSEFSETHQPSIYSALAEPFTEVTGTAEAKASLVWKNGELTSDGELVLKDIGFELAGVTFEDLDTTLTFTSLMPLVSEPNQRIALTRSDPGVPARNIEAVFEFLPAEGPLPAIRLNSARLEFLQSNIRFLPKTYDLNKEKFDIEARIENLDLAYLFELIDLDDIKGEGIISGVLPLSIRKDGVEIRGGRLQAVGPGHLSIRSPQARALLAPYGDQATLLVEALEDFYYSELEITVDKTFDEDLSAGISLLGSNPNVLEGHPSA